MPASLSATSVALSDVVARTSYSFSNVNFPSGKILLGVKVSKTASGAPSIASITHPNLSNITLIREATHANSTENRGTRIALYSADSSGGSGTLTININSTDAWSCQVLAWQVSDIDSIIGQADGLSSGDTDVDVTASPATGGAALGLALVGCYRTNTSGTISISNWTTADNSTSAGYFTFRGSGFTGTPPSAPVGTLSAGYMRPGIMVAVTWSEIAASSGAKSALIRAPGG